MDTVVMKKCELKVFSYIDCSMKEGSSAMQ